MKPTASGRNARPGSPAVPDRPNPREARVLKELILGDILGAHRLGGVGEKTLDGMMSKGWIELAHDADYDEDGYRITPAGEAAWS